MQQLGATMVAAADAHGAVRNDAGLDGDELTRHVATGGRLHEFDGGESVDPRSSCAPRATCSSPPRSAG